MINCASLLKCVLVAFVLLAVAESGEGGKIHIIYHFIITWCTILQMAFLPFEVKLF